MLIRNLSGEKPVMKVVETGLASSLREI